MSWGREARKVAHSRMPNSEVRGFAYFERAVCSAHRCYELCAAHSCVAVLIGRAYLAATVSAALIPSAT
jgi:hypothetical protein